MDPMTGLAYVIFILAMTAFARFKRQGLPADHGLNLASPGDEVTADRPASLFMRLAESVATNPDGPIDHEQFVLTPEPGAGYIPGLAEATVEWSEKGPDAKKVVALVYGINGRHISSWDVVEQNLRTIDVHANAQATLKTLIAEDITPEVASLFWDVARNSSDLNAIKWGLAIGTRFMSPEESRDLMILARHSEFTPIACTALVRESEVHPDYLELLIDLLHTTTGVGRLCVIQAILDVPALLTRDENRWMFIHEAGRGGLLPAIAWQIVEELDLPAMIRGRDLDAPGLDAVCIILDSAMNHGETLDSGRATELAIAIAEETSRFDPSPHVLSLMRTMKHWLPETCDEPDQRLLELIDTAYRYHLNPALLRGCIAGERGHDLALSIAIEERLVEMLDDVRADFEREPTPLNVVALATLGEEPELNQLYRWLLEGIDRAGRESLLRGASVGAAGSEHPATAYAIVLQFLGRLRNPEVVEFIRESCSDYDPMVRCSAMIAVAELEPWQLDDDLKRRVAFAAGDPFEFVREASVAAMQRHGIHSRGDEQTSPGAN